jgi:carboxymethylenebutenolidase
MGENVELHTDGNGTGGYLALPPGGRGPGLVLVQEWWGIDPALRSIADRLAEAGFVTLAPDLFHGELAGHDEMDKAAHLMNTLPADRAALDMSAAVDLLVNHEAVTGSGIGVVGLCMGGMLAWLLATGRPDRVKAVVAFYGYPSGDMEPDWSALTARVRGHMAENDDFFPPDGAHALEAKLQAMGKDVVITVHPDTGHAFMGPHNALGTHDEALAEELWSEVVAFLRESLD